jgi:hypothetical protein
MPTIRVQSVGDKAILSKEELDELLALARQSEDVIVEMDDVPTFAIMRLAEEGKAFDFWHDVAEDIYTLADGEPL